MLKIVLVDDEPLTLIHLEHILRSFSLPIEICGTASNSKEALQIIKETHPNIVITDIRMGNSNGLDLCEKLSIIMPYTKIIVISGYDEFEYAKRAIACNVTDYILKPINSEELYTRICNIGEIIQKDEKQQEYNIKLRNQIIDCLPMLNDWFFKIVKNYSYDSSKLAETFNLFNINILGSIYQIIYIEIDTFTNTTFENDVNKMDSFSKTLSLLVNHDIKSVYFYDTHSIIFIISCESISRMEFSRITYNIADKFLQYLEYNCNGNFSIGLSTTFKNIQLISNNVNEAKRASTYSFYIGHNKIISIDDVEERNKVNLTESFISLQENILMKIKMCNLEQSMDSLDLLLNELIEMQTSITFTKNKFIELYFYLLNSIEQEFGTLKDNADDLYTYLIKATSVVQIRQIFYLYFNQVIKTINDSRQDKSFKIIEKTKRYIQNNISKNISLESIAYDIGLSACYLSTLFKNIEHLSIKEYIINTRINHAKELLKDESAKIYEIALSVGYTDSRYFSQLFRKVTGYTPGQYREFLKQECSPLPL